MELEDNKLLPFLRDRTIHRPGVMYLSGHAVSGLCLIRLLTNGTPADWYDLFHNNRLQNASVTVLVRKDDFYKVELYNHVPWKDKIDPILLKKVSVEA